MDIFSMRTDYLAAPPLSIPAIFAMVGALVILAVGCSGIESVAEPEETGDTFLEMDVEPKTARIYINGEYRGTVDGWRHQIVPVEPGHHRLELRAEGFVTQRFDVDIGRGRWITLTARLQPSIDAPDTGVVDDEQEDHQWAPPPHPASPD